MKKQKNTRPATLAELASAGYRFDASVESAPAQEEALPEPTGAMRRALQDGGISLLKGAIAVPEAAVGLADLVTGGRAGKGAEAVGFRPGEAKAYLDTLYTPETQAAIQKVQQADGFVDTVGTALANPSVIGTSVAESVPMMGAGGVVGRGLAAVAPRMSAVLAGAAGEGVVGAGSAAEQIRQQSSDGLLTPEQAGLAAASGAGTALLGAAGGKVAAKLGIGDIDTMLAQGGRSAAQATALEQTKKGAVRRFLEGAMSEGVLEELPQSMQEQVLQNAALGKPLDEGVDTAAALGMLSGMAMGGPAGALGGPAGKAEQGRAEKLPDTGPMSRAVNAGIETTARDVERGAAVPGITAEQENDALTRMERAMADDQKGLKVYGPAGNEPTASMRQPGPAQAAEGVAQVVDSPFADRVLEITDALRDPTTRQAIQTAFGPEGMNEALHYLNLANQPQNQIPDRTRDRMLQMAEEIVSRAVLQPIPSEPGNGARFAPNDQQALAGQQQAPQIGLDTTPTGTIRVDGQGTAAPEVRADVISAEQRAAEAAALGKQAPRRTAPEPKPAPKTAVPALTNSPTPSGRMVAGRDGVRAETVAEVQARQREADADAALGLTPDVRRAQEQRKGVDDGAGDPAAGGSGDGGVAGRADAGGSRAAGGRAADGALGAVPAGAVATAGQAADGSGAGKPDDGALKKPPIKTQKLALAEAAKVGGKVKRVPNGWAVITPAVQPEAQANEQGPETQQGTREQDATAAKQEGQDQAGEVSAGPGAAPAAAAGPAAVPADGLTTAPAGDDIAALKKQWAAAAKAGNAERARAINAQIADLKAKPPKAASKSLAGDKIDDDWTGFSADSGSLGIPRADMPQIKAEHRGAMVQFLAARGISHEQAEVAASELKPTQAEFAPAKVKAAKDFDGDRSILVSSDGHVLDGHHQWLARHEAGEKVKVIRLDAPIKELLEAVKEFPSAATADGATEASTFTITREQEKRLRDEIHASNEAGGFHGIESARRYELLSKKFQRVADGRGSSDDIAVTKQWLEALSDSDAKQQQAVEDSEKAGAAAEQRREENWALLRSGKSDNPRYQAFLDTLGEQELAELKNNAPYMAWNNQRVGEWKKQHKGAHGDLSAQQQDQLTQYIRQWADEHLANRLKQPAPAAAPASKTPELDAHEVVMDAVRDGTVDLAAYKAGFKRMTENEAEVRAELNAQTKDKLLRAGGPHFAYRYKNSTKPEIVTVLYRGMVDEYALGKNYGPNTYTMSTGGLEAYEKLKRAALAELVEGQTVESLAEFAAEIKQAREEAAGRRAEAMEAIKNPQTLDQYRSFVRYQMGQGKSESDARLMLTPEQRRAYDDLAAESTRSKRKDRKDEARSNVGLAGQVVDGEIIATKHTKKGHDLFVVKLAERVSREDYETLNAGAKKIGGYYSSYRGGGALPGFQFTERSQAEAFVKLAQGEKEDAQQQAQARRDAFADDRSQTAVQRLTEMADRLEDQADGSLSQDRKTNTSRRADMAARAEASAQGDKALARTMRNIAQAIEGGKARFLDRVRQKVQVEALAGAVRTAKDAELRAKFQTYAEQEKHRGEAPTVETVDFATFPTFTAYRSDLASLGRQLLEVDGTKLLGQRLMKVADDVTEAYTDFAKANLLQVSAFRTTDGSAANFSNRDAADRAIARSGYRGKAIVLAVKRGENRIILSPSEAISRGIWKGDGDKRINLGAELGTELVEKLGRAARRGAKVSVPWQLESAHDKRQLLARMGIETAAEFRAALREFIGLREQPAAPDRVKELERAMVGRNNDGFDFFPTPADTADEMVEAAGIEPGMTVLEPSAGWGHIAERIREAGAEPDVGEIATDRRELLEAKGFNVIGRDFLDMTGTWDRIIMNPPFSDGRDIAHVRHAFELLKPGGRLVAIMGESAFTNQNKRATEFRAWLEAMGGTEEKLAEGTFTDPSLPVNTGANARMVVIERGQDTGTDGDRPAFSREADDNSARHMSVAEVQAAVQRITAGWANAPKVEVIESMTDAKVPQGVRDEDARQSSQSAAGEPEGFFYKGVAYLHAQHMLSEDDVRRVLFHEALGHFGLRGLYGKSLVPILDQIVSARPREVRAKAREYGLDFNSKADRYAAAEEVLAEMAQTRPEMGFVKRAVAAIRAWLRSIGLKGLKLSDSDIVAQFLLPARRFVEQGGQQARAGASGKAAASLGQSPEEKALQALSQNDDLFALPKSDKDTVEGITADNNPKIKVGKNTAIPGETRYNFTLPSGKTARLMVRKPNPYGPNLYGFDYVDGEMSDVLHERPGVNPEDVPPTGDVWIDVSLLESGQEGREIYNIAATYAHNTGRIFIGDPAGLSDEAMRRRPEQMLSSALKFGTTAHLAPHPRQVAGDKRLGIKPLRWVYGDDLGNIERLIDLNLDAIQNAGGYGEITFDPRRGTFLDAEGNELDRAGIALLSKELGVGRRAYAGVATIQRAAILRALRDDTQVRGAADAGAGAAGRDADGGADGSAVSGRLDGSADPAGAASAGRSPGSSDPRGEGSAKTGTDGRPVGLLERLRALGSERPDTTRGLFYSRNKPDAAGDRAAFSRVAESLRERVNSARDISLPAGYIADDFITKHSTLGFWQRTVGTPFNLAKKNPAFRKVFDAVQSFLGDVSSYASEAADLAPRILPKLDKLADLKKSPLSPADTQALSRPVFEGTLMWRRDENGEPVRVTDGDTAPAGIVWQASELRSMFGLTEPQIGLYREFRAATDESLRSLTVSEMVRVGGKDIEGMRDRLMGLAPADAALAIMEALDGESATAASAARRTALGDTAERVQALAIRFGELTSQGYAPLSRFGTYTLDVLDSSGQRVYFGLFESQSEANRMARKLRGSYPGATVSQGTLAQETYKLFAGLSPETVELFGELLGLDAQGDSSKDAVFQEYIKRAKTTRSAMRRLIHRKGIAGFSEDAGRVLAGFIYSNARNTSANLHQGSISEAVQAIPKGQGELADYALKMAEYVRNPQEEAQRLRGIMFAQFLGGSVASALVNMTQPVAVTFPFLSQFGGVRAAASQIARAFKDVTAGSTGDAALDAALKRAEEEGIVSPQEVFHLMAQAQGKSALKAGDGTTVGNAAAAASNGMSKLSLAWGKLFGLAEQINRRVTFIAAYRMAPEGVDPAKFAAEAVTETQFTYNKGNKPQWARGTLGSLLFTFKQYSVNYVELLARLASSGPEGRKAALLAVAVLALVGGADELPFLKDVEDVVDGLLQRLGYNFSTETARNRFLAELIGKDAAQFVAKGISGLPGAPIDVSGRLGMGNLIPGTGLFLKRQDYTNDVLEIAGPAAKLGQNIFRGAGELVAGRPVEAVTAVLPVAAQNAIKGASMAATGEYRDTKGRKVLDTTLGEAVAKAIGFQPNSVARTQEAAREVARTIELVKLEKSEIQSDWAQGLADGDTDAVQSARERLMNWNRSNPEAPIRVSVRDIRKKVLTLQQDRATRLAKTAPKAMRGEIKKTLEEAGG